MLADRLVPALRRHLPQVRHLHELDLRDGLLGHSDVRTTMIYTHVLNRGGRGAIGPFDRQAHGDHETDP